MPEADRVPLDDDDARRLRAREPRKHVLRRSALCHAQRTDRRVRHRSRKEERLSRRPRQRPQTVGNQLADVLGDGQRLPRGRSAFLQKRRSELEREERVAARGPVDAQQRGPAERAPEPCLDQLMQRTGAQRADANALEAAVGEGPVEAEQRRPRARRA